MATNPAAAGFHVCHLGGLASRRAAVLGLGGRCSPYPASSGFASVLFVGFARFYVHPCVQHVPDGGTVIPSPMGEKRPPSGHVEGPNEASIFSNKKEAHRTPQFGEMDVDDRRKRERIA